MMQIFFEQDSDEFFSIQLRLGENIDVYNTLPDRSQRFRFIDTDDDGGGGDDDRMYAFFPRRWQYDFGYVLNLDGVVCRRRDLLVDFAGDPDQRGWPAARGPFADCRTPGCIEDRWIRRSLRRRSRQWQVMYSRHSAVVNNVLPDDRRVANQADGKPSEASLELARRLVIEHRKLDVASFAALRADAVRSTHTKLPIGYVDLDMDCR